MLRSSKVGCFLFCSVFVFVGRTSHPSLVSSLSLVSLLLLIYFSSFLIKKEKKDRTY